MYSCTAVRPDNETRARVHYGVRLLLVGQRRASRWSAALRQVSWPPRRRRVPCNPPSSQARPAAAMDDGDDGSDRTRAATEHVMPAACPPPSLPADDMMMITTATTTGEERQAEDGDGDHVWTRRERREKKRWAKLQAYGRRKQRDPLLRARLSILAGLPLGGSSDEGRDDGDRHDWRQEDDDDHRHQQGGVTLVTDCIPSLDEVPLQATSIDAVEVLRPLTEHEDTTGSTLSSPVLVSNRSSLTSSAARSSTVTRRSRASSLGTLVLTDGLFPTPPNRALLMANSDDGTVVAHRGPPDGDEETPRARPTWLPPSDDQPDTISPDGNRSVEQDDDHDRHTMTNAIGLELGPRLSRDSMLLDEPTSDEGPVTIMMVDGVRQPVNRIVPTYSRTVATTSPGEA